MTEYRNIHGKRIKSFATDLDNEQAEGQLFYSETSDDFKVAVPSTAWHSSGGLVDARRYLAGAGTQTAAFGAGGIGPTGEGSGNRTAKTEHYDGTGWSNGGNLATATNNKVGAGTFTAGLAFGGSTASPGPGNLSAVTEEYNGSAWTSGGNMGTGRINHAGAGTQTAGLGFAGYTTTNLNSSEEYDGSSWTAGGNLNTARRSLAGAGLQTAGLAFGGYTTTVSNATEEYDGSSWTAGGNLNTARNGLGGSGIQTAALGFGGRTPPPYSSATELYNGSTWTTSPATLGTARQNVSNSGTQSRALAFGGESTANLANTEEFNVTVNTVTAGAWASGGNMNTGRGTGGDCGIYNAGLVFGGNPYGAPYTSDTTEEYDGTSWTESGDLAHATSDASGAGTQTAALCFGLSSSPNLITQTYDGSSWTTVPASLPTAQNQGRGIGTQTAALICGVGTESFEYDGSSWTASGDLNNNRSSQKPGGWGLQTAAVLAGGYFSPPATIISNTETYNGTSWTETGHSLLTALKRTAATTAAPSSNGLIFSGPVSAGSNTSAGITQGYDGTAWFTQPSLATARTNAQGFGTATNAVAAGGHGFPGGQLNATEEFTGETTAVNLKTVTDS